MWEDPFAFLNVTLLGFFCATAMRCPVIETRLTKATPNISFSLHICDSCPGISAAQTIFITCRLEISVPGPVSVRPTAGVSQHGRSSAKTSPAHFLTFASTSAIYQTSFPNRKFAHNTVLAGSKQSVFYSQMSHLTSKFHEATLAKETL